MSTVSIVTLGTKGNIPAETSLYKNHSGVLIDSTLLLDFGEKKFLRHHPAGIFITHLHPDHACFILHKTGPLNCPVYAPELWVKEPAVKKLSRSIRIGDFKITPIPTIHSFKVVSQGYLLEGKGKRIFYSGDVITIEQKYLKKLKHLDVVITEASYFRQGGMVRKFDSKIAGHNGLRELIKLFRPYTKRIIFMHFGSWFLENTKEGRKKLLELSDESLTVEVAHDGKKFTV